MPTFFDTAKQAKTVLENALDVADKALKEFDLLHGKSAYGMTPEHVKAMPEWQQAKREFDKAFSDLRNYNGWYMKTFKKEVMAECRNKYK